MTERLARACAAHPGRTLALWGVAVVGAIALVATSLHGLTTQAHVIGSPQSGQAIAEIEKSFPDVAAQLKGDVILVSSPRYTVKSAQAQTFAHRLFASLSSQSAVSGVRFVGVNGSPEEFGTAADRPPFPVCARLDEAVPHLR